MTKYSIAKKVDILTLLYSGASKKSLSRKFQLDKRMLTIWDLRYKKYGLKGLICNRRRSVTEDFKKEVVRKYRNGQVSLRQTSVDYNISFATLKNWIRKYDKT